MADHNEMKNKFEIKKKLGYFKVLEDQVNLANLANQARHLAKLGKLNRKVSFH